MLKALAGDPGNQLLILGLSFGNLDKFKAEPFETFIPIRREETGLPFDVLLYSGDSKRVMGVTRDERRVFLIGLGEAQLDLLKEKPGGSVIHLEGKTYDLPVSIMIYSAETEMGLADQVAELIGSGTVVNIDRRLVQ